jgi:hypothetical protein
MNLFNLFTRIAGLILLLYFLMQNDTGMFNREMVDVLISPNSKWQLQPALVTYRKFI